MSDDEFDDWMATLPPPPGWDRTDEEEEADILRAEAQAEAHIAAGRYYPQSVVSAWLATWGSSDYKPFQEWLKSSG